MCRTAEIKCEGRDCNLEGLPAPISKIGTWANRLPLNHKIACGHVLEQEYLEREQIEPFYCSKGKKPQDPIYCTSYQHAKVFDFPIICGRCLKEVHEEINFQKQKLASQISSSNPPSQEKKLTRTAAIGRLEMEYQTLKEKLATAVTETKQTWDSDKQTFARGDIFSVVNFD